MDLLRRVLAAARDRDRDGHPHDSVSAGVTAPFLLSIGVVLLGWAMVKAGGFGPMLAAPSKFQTFGEFFNFFVPSLTGVVGFWATVALNIPDFTRYARSQRAQIVGQALGLPTTMTLYSFIGIAVTSATTIIFGQAIWDPVQVLARLGNPIAVVVAMLALLVATLNVNVAANLVSPSNDFSNLSPRLISFRTGGLIACVVGVAVFQPWKLLANSAITFSNGSSAIPAFLARSPGVMICDYFVVRKKIILVEDLYQRGISMNFRAGINWRAMAALAAGRGIAFIGLVVPALRVLYDYAWFVGFAASFVVYWVLMRESLPVAFRCFSLAALSGRLSQTQSPTEAEARPTGLPSAFSRASSSSRRAGRCRSASS
jgi:NCS1 family nucleobase:cation symporter-1